MAKKKKSKKSSEEGEAEEKPQAPPPILDKVVILEFKLLNWKYMNFSMQFRETTNVFSIKKLLAERHGKIESLKLCLNSFTEATELHDEMLTLAESGAKGRQPDMKYNEVDGTYTIDKETIPVYQIFYDFKPLGSCPILLSSK